MRRERQPAGRPFIDNEIRDLSILKTMEKNCCIIAGLVFFAACSCQRETLSEPETILPVMAIDVALQQYGEELMQNKEGVLLAFDLSTETVLANVFKADQTDSLKILDIVKRCQSEGFPKVSPDEIETMWWNVNGGVGTGAYLWIAHVDGLDICGKGVSITADENPERPVFLGFAPRENPRIVVLSYIKGRPHPATYSAPIGSLMIERYLNGGTLRPDLERRMKSARPILQRIQSGR